MRFTRSKGRYSAKSEKYQESSFLTGTLSLPFPQAGLTVLPVFFFQGRKTSVLKGKSEKLYQISINTSRKTLIRGDTRQSPKLMLMDMLGMENDYVHTLTGGTMETIPIPGILSPSPGVLSV